MELLPKLVEIGKPEEKPGILIEPLYDPVPRDIPKEVPRPTEVPDRELVPA